MPSSSRSGWGRSGHRRALVAGAVVLVVVLGSGAAAWAASSSGNSGYRTASVTRSDIGTSLTVVGSVEPVNDASAAFQVAGKVATVTAAVGQQVTAGESLGTLDTTALSETVSSDESTVNADEAKLTQDETSQSTASTQTPTSASSTTTTTTSPASHGGGSTGTSSTITQDQTTLTKDEATTSADQQEAAADMAQAQKACGTSGTPATTTTTTTNPSGCVTALDQVSKDQQEVSADQAAVAKDEAALSQALSQSSSSSTGTSASAGSAGVGAGATGNSGTGDSGTGAEGSRAISSTSSTGTGSSNADTAGTGGSGTGGTAGASTDTPEQIASDQADIDSADAQLTEAEQSLAEANLTSPINGTIVSVGITVGDTVTANSSIEVIVIVGTESFEVTGTLSSSQVTSVKVGDAADVEVDGVDGDIAGTVSQVGPVQSSDGSYTYPVVVGLPTSATGLFTGSTANLDIATGEVRNVVAVPTSAVQTLATRSYVETLTNGTPTRKVIKVGMVGNTYTQVLSGLTPGESVVLADYAEAVPSSNTDTLGGVGGFGGGGLGGGGGAFRARAVGGGGFGG